MKKIILILSLLCVVIICGLIFIEEPGKVVAASNLQEMFDMEGGAYQEKVSAGIHAVQVNALVPFTGGNAKFGTWGGEVSHAVELYKWDGDYATTIDGEVLATANIPATPNDSFVNFTFLDDGGNVYTAESGEYLMVFSSTKGSTSYIYKITTPVKSYHKVFLAGMEQDVTLSMKLNFTDVSDTYFGEVSESESGINYDFYLASNPKDVHKAYFVENNAASQFIATAPFNSIIINTPTWGGKVKSVRFALFKWDVDYKTTVSGEPVATYYNHFGGASDDPDTLFKFSKQEPGEYLLVVYNTEDNTDSERPYSIVWIINENFEGQRMYKDGKVDAGKSLQFTIAYTRVPEKMYGAPLSSSVYIAEEIVFAGNQIRKSKLVPFKDGDNYNTSDLRQGLRFCFDAPEVGSNITIGNTEYIVSEVGALVMLERNMAEGFEMLVENLASGAKMVKQSELVPWEDNGNIYNSAYVYNIPEAEKDTAICVRMYIKCEKEGKTVYAYSEVKKASVTDVYQEIVNVGHEDMLDESVVMWWK